MKCTYKVKLLSEKVQPLPYNVLQPNVKDSRKEDRFFVPNKVVCRKVKSLENTDGSNNGRILITFKINRQRCLG